MQTAKWLEGGVTRIIPDPQTILGRHTEGVILSWRGSNHFNHREK